MIFKKSNIQIIIIFCFISCSYFKSIEIYEEIKMDFNYCKSTKDLLSIDNMCEGTALRNLSETLDCIDDLKRLKTDILENNEFIETKHNKKVVYLSNGEYFQTSCQKIERVYIPQIFDFCTKDILLYFYANGIKTFGFLSVFGIIKDTSFKIECSDKYSTVRIDNFQFIKYRNMIKVNNLLPISEALQNKLNTKVEEKIADLMITSLNSKNPFMIAMVCISVFTFLLIVLMISLLNTRKKKSLFNFLLR
jgi:hypothetical protein